MTTLDYIFMLLKGNSVNFFDCNYLFSHYNESKHFLLLPGYPYSHKDLFWLWKLKYSKRVHSKLLNTYCWWHKVVTRYIVLDCTSILEGVTIWPNMYASLKFNRNVYNAMHTIYYDRRPDLFVHYSAYFLNSCLFCFIFTKNDN